ncbi:hypothetical protein D3A96_12065 [Robertkochia marina]|nr:hypothetical protein D3A96_12065 [Robertkochia marina]
MALILSIVLCNCSIQDDDILANGQDQYPGDQWEYDEYPTGGEEPSDSVPDQDSTDNNYPELKGYPKHLKQYQNGILEFEAIYYFRADGQIAKIKYGYPNASSGTFTDEFHYDAAGRLVKLEGWDVYNFYWTNGQITKASLYNAAWYGTINIYYEYNDKGQITARTDDYVDASFMSKYTYSYYEDGNLKTIEEHGKINNSGEMMKLTSKSFEGYTEYQNSFLEFVIIPGKIVQEHFPLKMEHKNFQSPSTDYSENYQYTYDTEGKVIAKETTGQKVVYEYY